MIIIGHNLIPYKPLFSITNIDKISQTEPNSTILFEFNNKILIQYCKENNISFALHVNDIVQICIANALGAKYVIVQEKLAKKAQDLANEYLFDTKIILYVKEEKDMNKAAKNYIDGVIFENSIKYL